MPFNDSVTAGDYLVQPAIKSTNYVPGSTGWAIMADGTAEFNGVTINGGQLLVRDTDGSYVKIYDENPGSGAIIEIKPADVSGHTIDPAVFTTIANATGAVVNFDGPSIDGISPPGFLFETQTTDPKQLIIITADSNLDSRINIATSILSVLRGGTLKFVVDATADLISLKTGSTVIEGNLGGSWAKPTLVNGWTNRGGAFADFQYRKIANNMVHIIGEIVPGTTANGTVVTTLPVGFRPVDSQLIYCSANPTAYLYVLANGQVQVFGATGATLLQIVSAIIPLDSTT